ncbi:MAG: hypothetical protein CMJ89_13200 [Planctomycetes bacterium]|jgi:hypothetical protein|nr:hypothetical protein [Planctomycetota bacterium]
MKIITLLVLLGVAAFSALGFVATFEPMDGGTRIVWRAVYAVAFTVSLATAAWTLRRGRRSG